MSVNTLTTKHDSSAIAVAVKQVVQQISNDPETAKVVFQADSELTRGLLADITIREFNIKSDEPESLGGTDKGPNPVELVLGAFAACQEIVIAAYASVLGVKIEKIQVQAEGNLDLRGFFNVSDNVRAGFNRVTYKTDIETKEADLEKLDQLRFYAQNRCPVLDILQNNVETTGTVTFN